MVVESQRVTAYVKFLPAELGRINDCASAGCPECDACDGHGVAPPRSGPCSTVRWERRYRSNLTLVQRRVLRGR